MNAADVLRAARAKIATPDRWTQGTDARLATREPCSFANPNAVAYCAIGALTSVIYSSAPAGPEPMFEISSALLQKACGGGSVVIFNDSHDHPDVLALFDKAITAAEASAV